MMSNDYLQYYDLETYLLETVQPRFHADGYLSAFDFFCIVIWKSNRAKSKIARRLLSITGKIDLDEAVKDLTASLSQFADAKERMRCLLGVWGFRLPMASAILTILYPDDFTIYDYRVCQSLDNFYQLANTTRFDRLWEGYVQFCQAVAQAAPDGLSLRDKDRYLWAKSFSTQLNEDIKVSFMRGDESETI